MKNIILTGATSGIGKALAFKIAKKGHSLILISRNLKKGQDTVKEIQKATHNKNLYLLQADLSSLKSIKKVCDEILSEFNSIDVLINNAGISLQKRELSLDGIEKVFATNYLGHFNLTNLLLEKIKLSSPSRIINITSQAQKEIDFDDIMSEKNYNQMSVYSKSKSANIMFTFELARRLKNTGVTVNCVHPGVVNTNIYDNINFIAKVVVKMISVFFISPDKSADKILPLILDDKYENTTGKYFIDLKETNPKSYNFDEEKQKLLWEISKNLTELK